MHDRAVLITAIICGSFLALGALMVLGYLVYQQRDTAAILSLVSTIISAVTLKVAADARSLANQVKEQTNGTQSRLVEAVISK